VYIAHLKERTPPYKSRTQPPPFKALSESLYACIPSGCYEVNWRRIYLFKVLKLGRLAMFSTSLRKRQEWRGAPDVLRAAEDLKLRGTKCP
jgi:hypothetical protein